VLNSDIRDRLAAAQAFHWEVSQTLSDMAQRLRNPMREQDSDGDGCSLLAEFLQRRPDGASDGD